MSPTRPSWTLRLRRVRRRPPRRARRLPRRKRAGRKEQGCGCGRRFRLPPESGPLGRAAPCRFFMRFRPPKAQSPWTAADTLAGLWQKDLIFRQASGSRGTRADQGVCPTNSAPFRGLAYPLRLSQRSRTGLLEPIRLYRAPHERRGPHSLSWNSAGRRPSLTDQVCPTYAG